MSTSLYRKYRPQDFSQIVGQNHVKVTLINELESGKISHAYLFSGPHGVGKTTMARILTKALNCHKRKGAEPCNECLSCQGINEARSLDMIEIDAASNRGINEIRELREQVKFVPLKENYKVFIIDEVHMLTTEAFNALLKTLEEPPSHVVFVLATTEIHKVPETIISRCQHFDFKKVPINDIKGHLTEVARREGIKVEEKVLENIARRSGGYLRDAVSVLGQIVSLGDKEVTEEEAQLVLPRSDWQIVVELLLTVFCGQSGPALAIVHKYIEQGGDIEFFSKETTELLRKILLSQVTTDWQELLWELDEAAVKKIKEALLSWSVDDLRKVLEFMLQALQEIRYAEILSLPLELVIIKAGQLNNNSDNSSNDDRPKPSFSQPETKKPAADTAKKSGTKPLKINLSLNQVMENWPKVIQELKAFNHSLASFLKEGQPLRLEDQYLVIGFRYNFHWERINELKYKVKVEEVLQQVLGCQLLVKGEIDETLAQTKNFSGQKSPDMVESVLETLGGEVVN